MSVIDYSVYSAFEAAVGERRGPEQRSIWSLHEGERVKTWGKILAFGGLAIFVFLVLAVATIDQKSLKKQNDLSACDERFAGNNALRSDCRAQKIQGWIAEEKAADCDAMHRNETGVWVWSKTPEERAACQVSKR